MEDDYSMSALKKSDSSSHPVKNVIKGNLTKLFTHLKLIWKVSGSPLIHRVLTEVISFKNIGSQ